MNIKKLVNYLIVILLLNPSFAFAYLDPGSGGFIIQMLIAFVASIVIFFKNGMMYLRNFFSKFLSLFSKKKVEDQKDSKENN